MLTKGAIGNLVNRYNAVLKKCHLINTFSSLAVAAMLVMGAAAGEAFGQFIGYDVTSPSSTGPTVSGTDVSTEADARGINAFAEGNHALKRRLRERREPVPSGCFPKAIQATR